MDLKDIQDLIKFVAKSGATEVDLEIDNVKISIKSPPKKRRETIPTRSSQNKRVESKKKRGELKRKRQSKFDYF